MAFLRPQRYEIPGSQRARIEPPLGPIQRPGEEWGPATITTVEDAGHAYLFDLEASGRSRYRQEKVDLCLRTFTMFLAATGRSSRLDGLDAQDVREFLLWLKGRGLASRTINDRLVDLKSLFNWLVRNEHAARSPAAAVRTLPQPQAELAVLSHAQIAALLAQPDRRTWSGYRDFAMMTVLYDTGLRVSELLGLHLPDVLWVEQQLRVWGKGQKERRVPFGHETGRTLRGWLQRRGEWPVDRVFVTSYGRALTRRRAARIVAHYGRMARITGVRMSPHTLRHTFATHFLEAGGDLFTLQAILGHRGLEMVRRYAHLTERTIRLRHRQFSPLDRLREGQGT